MIGSKKRVLSRRAVLRGGAQGVTVALALPALEAMFDGNGAVHAADGTPPPKRVGVFYWGNGIRPEQWIPAQEGATWTSPALAPLAPVQRYVSVLTGFECKHRGTAHHVGRSGVLAGSYDKAAGTPLGGATTPSFDRLVSDAWRGRTPFEVVHVGISMRRKGGIDAQPASTSSSWDAGFHMARADYSPAALYMRLFQNVRGAGPEDPARARELLARRSAIDLVSADAQALQARLGQSDRRRIEQHLEGLRDLERGLSITAGANCQPRPVGADPKVDLGHEDLDARNAVMSDILAMALACDLTRVIVVTYSVMQADTIFWQVGATEGCHVVTHDDRKLPADQLKPPQKELHGRIVKYTMGHFAQLLGRLAATPEGAGNLLDSAAILATSEIGDGTAHALTDVPLLIAGRAGGALKSGLHYRSPSKESTSKAVLTVLRAVEPGAFPTFGKDVGLADQPVSALLT
jgi:hypothetical protein